MKTIISFLLRDWRIETSYRLNFIIQILSFFPVIVMFYFLSRLVDQNVEGILESYGGKYFPFVLLGISVQHYFHLSLHSFAKSVRESQLSGTLEAVMVTPVTRGQFLVGSAFYSFLINPLRIILYIFFGCLFFHVEIHLGRIPIAFGAMVVIVAAFSCLGIFSAGFILLFKKGAGLNQVFNMIFWLIGGVYYPVEILPQWLQNLSDYVPMAHALKILRISLLTEKSLDFIKEPFLLLFLWVIIGLPASYAWFAFCLKQARIRGTLGHY